jgi:monovalent cation/hydrogen antiporter
MTSLHIVEVCLSLLALTCAASLLQRILNIPLPFLQIAVGTLAALPPLNWQVPLEPQTFLLLFLPLLLFGDGWRLPRRGLMGMPGSVFGYAVILVLLTTLIGGYLLHWLIPGMPLSVAFAVGALVSPTDAVAVSAITRKLNVPHRMRHLLESEALLNDASGLVAMRIAVAVTLSGGFSPLDAAGEFLWVASAGIVIGIALALLYHQVHRRLFVRADDAMTQTILNGLLPFAAFALAERVEASGILAAVAAGITASRLHLLEGAHYSARIMSGTTWEIVSFCLNGIIFVLLGLQLPGIVGAGPSGIDLFTSTERLTIFGQIALLTLALVAIRFAWVVASLGVARVAKKSPGSKGWREIAASTIAGARGVVTLAGALSIPLAMPDGTPFPYRDLAITLAAGVILLSLLIAAIGLPILLRGVSEGADADTEIIAARRAAIEAAVSAIEKEHAADASRSPVLIASYRARALALDDPAQAANATVWRRMYSTALHAERRTIQGLRVSDKIDDIAARQLLAELDLLEAALMHRPLPPDA